MNNTFICSILIPKTYLLRSKQVNIHSQINLYTFNSVCENCKCIVQFNDRTLKPLSSFMQNSKKGVCFETLQNSLGKI